MPVTFGPLPVGAPSGGIPQSPGSSPTCVSPLVGVRHCSCASDGGWSVEDCLGAVA